MNSALVHPSTRLQLDALQKKMPQSLLISSNPEVGLGTIAMILIQEHTLISWLRPEADKQSISITQIRELYRQTAGKSTQPRFVVIDRADHMTREAQNAFLKLLEEPPAAIHFLLLHDQQSTLLPTISSRCQQLIVHPITTPQSEALVDTLQVIDSAKRQQLLFIAAGLPAQLTRLATDDEAFAARVQIVKDARTLLQAPLYDRLKLIEAYKNDRQAATTLIRDAINMLASAPELKETVTERLELLLAADEAISISGNIRLHLQAAVV